MFLSYYPGHIAKSKRNIIDNIKNIDIIIEILDARAPISTKINFNKNEINGKYYFVFLNKSDLSDQSKNNYYKDYFIKKGYITECISSKNKNNNIIDKIINLHCLKRIEKMKSKGIQNVVLKAMVIGMPNVGKSTFINNYANKKIAKVENKPGVTRALQWIKISDKLLLLDTPGITSKKFENNNVGENLILIGSISDKLAVKQDIVYNFLKYVYKEYKSCLVNRYKLNELKEDEDIISLFEKIALNTGCVKRKNVVDFDKVSDIILNDFRAGRLGLITLYENVGDSFE